MLTKTVVLEDGMTIKEIESQYDKFVVAKGKFGRCKYIILKDKIEEHTFYLNGIFKNKHLDKDYTLLVLGARLT